MSVGVEEEKVEEEDVSAPDRSEHERVDVASSTRAACEQTIHCVEFS